MAAQLSPYRLGKARDLYNIFNAFNSFSYTLLAGSIITLFALRLSATSTFIGILNALVYVAFFFLPLGKLLARRFAIIRIYSIAWIVRAVGMAPLLIAPYLASTGQSEFALQLTLMGVLAFHISRGIGMIGNNPVLNDLSYGPDRSSYMTQIQVINNAVGMISNFAIALLLGRDPPLFLYAVIIACGIIGGVASGFMLKNIPEPQVNVHKSTEENFFTILKESSKQPSFKQFIVLLLLLALVSGIARVFIVVYSREVFKQDDGMVSLYAVFGGLGSMMIGFIVKFLIDRVGAKPLFICCTIISLISMIPVVLFPAGAVDNLIPVILYLSFLFFIMNFGFIGAEGIAQTYFLALIPEKYMLDMGIVYFFCFAIAGSGGSLLAGIFLDLCTSFNLGIFNSYKILYGILIVLTIIVLLLQRTLVLLGALSLKSTIEVLFSLRDLKAITLLDRLNKTNDSQEEEAILDALHDTPSQLSIHELLDRVSSPLLSTRQEAIRAMETLPMLTGDAEKALMNDIVNNPYTTAYISARILGKQKIFSAIPLLRELALSDDYMLAGEAIIALARLGDEAFRPQIEKIISQTTNPRLIIMGIEAFGIYHASASLTILLDILRNTPVTTTYLRDEVVLSMSRILDIQNKFYALLIKFLEDPSLCATLALDEAEAATEYYKSLHSGWNIFRNKERFAHSAAQAQALQPAVAAYIQGKGALFSRWIWELPDTLVDPTTQMVLAETVLDTELCSILRLQLLISHWGASKLREWSETA
jgi:HEAT repeat protein